MATLGAFALVAPRGAVVQSFSVPGPRIVGRAVDSGATAVAAPAAVGAASSRKRLAGSRWGVWERVGGTRGALRVSMDDDDEFDPVSRLAPFFGWVHSFSNPWMFHDKVNVSVQHDEDGIREVGIKHTVRGAYDLSLWCMYYDVTLRFPLQA